VFPFSHSRFVASLPTARESGIRTDGRTTARSLRLLHNCSDCYRLERKLPGGSTSHWEIAPFHGALQSWHTQSELVTSPAQNDELALADCDTQRTARIVKHLWLLGNDLAIFPNVNRCSVHARHFPGTTCGAPHPATDAGSKTF